MCNSGWFGDTCDKGICIVTLFNIKSRVIVPYLALYRKIYEVHIVLWPVLHFQNTLARLLPVEMGVYARKMMTEQTIHAHVPMKAAFMHLPAKTVKLVSICSSFLLVFVFKIEECKFSETN